MAVYDQLLRLREGGTTPEVTATETGATSVDRDATTGKAVVQIDKMPEEGLPIVVYAAADTGTSADRTQTVTIEASDVEGSGYATILTFPTLTYADTAAKTMVMRTGTQKKYLRHVITLVNSNGTMSRIYKIYVGLAAVNQ